MPFLLSPLADMNVTSTNSSSYQKKQRQTANAMANAMSICVPSSTLSQKLIRLFFASFSAMNASTSSREGHSNS